ncbi:TorS-related protein [Allostella sp. ATCC 35155]|nr:TorS-related protein [Stella sp. ATCC 35155]
MLRLPLTDQSHIGAARREAVRLAISAGWCEEEQARLALVVTEMSVNTIRHGGGGEVLVGRRAFGTPGIEAIWMDRGHGMADPEACFRDGHSTAGTPGNGLGAVIRMSDAFDCYSQPDQGTVVLVRIDDRARNEFAPCGWAIGAVDVAKPGQDVSGDAWAVRIDGPHLSCMVVDGLGHGPAAAAAAAAAVRAFDQAPPGEPVPVLQAVHEAMRPTRGGAVAVLRADRDRRTVSFSGIGNIAGGVAGVGVRHMVSMNGTAGGAAPRLRAFDYPFAAQDVVILHSDGVSTSWSLAAYPGLVVRDPGTIAAVLLRDHGRGRDDATVLVVRDRAA